MHCVKQNQNIFFLSSFTREVYRRSPHHLTQIINWKYGVHKEGKEVKEDMHVEPCPDQITNLITLLLEVQDKYNKNRMVEMEVKMAEEKEVILMLL